MKIDEIGSFLMGFILLILSGVSFAADQWCRTAEATVQLESLHNKFAYYAVRTLTYPTKEAERYKVEKLDIEVDVNIVMFGRKDPRGEVERYEANTTLRVRNIPFGSSQGTATGWNQGIDFEGPWKTERIITKEVRCAPAR